MKLPLKFYQRDTIQVAKDLLGKTLVHIIQDKKGRKIRLSGKIVETEAYLGAKDLASHARRGLKSARNASLYLAGGFSYVYQVYGLHFCFNVVTKNKDEPEAVLIRALEPLEGLDHMKQLRHTEIEKNLTNGPGKLGEALGITKKLDGGSLISETFFIEEPRKKLIFKIIKAKRVGVDYSGIWAAKPLRFYIHGNLFVSKK